MVEDGSSGEGKVRWAGKFDLLGTLVILDLHHCDLKAEYAQGPPASASLLFHLSENFL